MIVSVGMNGKHLATCTMFYGPSKSGAQEVLDCDEPSDGEMVSIWSHEWRSNGDPLSIDEVILLGYK